MDQIFEGLRAKWDRKNTTNYMNVLSSLRSKAYSQQYHAQNCQARSQDELHKNAVHEDWKQRLPIYLSQDKDGNPAADMEEHLAEKIFN